MYTEMVQITGVVKRKSARAILIESDGIEGWVPFSLIEEGPLRCSEGEVVDITIPEWKAEEYWG